MHRDGTASNHIAEKWRTNVNRQEDAISVPAQWSHLNDEENGAGPHTLR
jgi:hypothetical protein